MSIYLWREFPVLIGLIVYSKNHATLYISSRIIILGRGRPEPATSSQQPTTFQQFGSGTGSGSAIKFSGLVLVPAEKCKNVAGSGSVFALAGSWLGSG